MFFRGSVEKASSWRWMKLQTRRRCSVGAGPGHGHLSLQGATMCPRPPAPCQGPPAHPGYKAHLNWQKMSAYSAEMLDACRTVTRKVKVLPRPRWSRAASRGPSRAAFSGLSRRLSGVTAAGSQGQRGVEGPEVLSPGLETGLQHACGPRGGAAGTQTLTHFGLGAQAALLLSRASYTSLHSPTPSHLLGIKIDRVQMDADRCNET